MRYARRLAVFALALGLIFAIPVPPAAAGSRGGAVAAGIVGAVGAAVILNQLSKSGRAKAQPVRSKSAQGAAAKQSAENVKDPFAGASSVPAGYAKPVGEAAAR
jgi:hypothetical protein